METYSYHSYPESGNSPPRSREIEFENPPPWDGQHLPYKAKFMCSYGGKIHHRSRDNQLSYVGGETKILTVDRTIKFSAFFTKLSSLCDSDVTFKYQLPGEDLDALVYVTNDDDLDHMMYEFDRLYRSSGKQARIRLFLFPLRNLTFTSDGGRSDREQFSEDLNSVPDNVVEAAKPPVLNNVDFLLGLDKVPPPPPVAAQLQDQVPEPVASPPEFSLCPVSEDPVSASNPILSQIDIQSHAQEFQRLQINLEHEQGMYTRKSAENLGCYSGDYYVQNLSHKTLPVPTSVTGTPAFTASAGFLPEKYISNGGFPVTMTTTTGNSAGSLHAPSSWYIFSNSMNSDKTSDFTGNKSGLLHYAPYAFRKHQMYNIMSYPAQPPLSAAPPSTLPSQPSRGATAYSEGISVIRQNNGVGNMGMASDTGPYTQVGYDSATGRQVYYTVAGGMVQPHVSAPYSALPVAGGTAAIVPDGQFVAMASPGSV